MSCHASLHFFSFLSPPRGTESNRYYYFLVWTFSQLNFRLSCFEHTHLSCRYRFKAYPGSIFHCVFRGGGHLLEFVRMRTNNYSPQPRFKVSKFIMNDSAFLIWQSPLILTVRLEFVIDILFCVLPLRLFCPLSFRTAPAWA